VCRVMISPLFTLPSTGRCRVAPQQTSRSDPLQFLPIPPLLNQSANFRPAKNGSSNM
jgi:hypothetical protein